MTREHAKTDFQRWIENRRWFREEDLPLSVGIAGAGSELCARLGEAVAHHLSDSDPAAPGGWLFFGNELVEKVATKSGIAELAKVFPEISSRGYSPCSERRCGFLADVAKIGGAVFSLPDACKSLRKHPDLFVAGIETDRAEPHLEADLTVDLKRLGEATCVRVIADSALEWAQSRTAPPNNITPWKS